MAKNYLTKSRFKAAFACPTKLYYLDRKHEYGNKMSDNDFLKALAQGGYQVGALAKVYYGPGVDLEALGTEDAIVATRELLQQGQVTIFEATLQVGELLVRVDVLKKKGTTIELLEVKSKSHDFATSDFFKRHKRTGAVEKVDNDWLDYLMDVAFQTYVAERALPHCSIHPSLVLADKRREASVDGIHQHFLIQNDKGKATVQIHPGVTKEQLGISLLSAANVRAEVDYLIGIETYLKDQPGTRGVSFEALVNTLADHLKNDRKYPAAPSAECKHCEFRTKPDPASGLKSGFEECWSEQKSLAKENFTQPWIFDLWDGRRTQDWLDDRRLLLTDLTANDLSNDEIPDKASEDGLTRTQRQLKQIQMSGSKVAYFDLNGFSIRRKSFTYPYHFIDFETTMVAIPFHQGRKPYEQLAFQFSHHILHENGSIVHHDQFISTDRGAFPNFDFVRALKSSLSSDDGTIFRFSHHENTVLRQIMRQIEAAKPDDAKELIEFILSITQPSKKDEASSPPAGKRNMVDLCDLVKRFYLHPDMGGSNSIKVVMPAILNDSQYLKAKYAEAIYGKAGSISSQNEQCKKSWVKLGAGQRVIDPYKSLPKIMADVDPAEFEGRERCYRLKT